MPKLVLGPLLRYVGETQATVWVETDDAARVEVLVSPGGPGQEADGGTRGRAPTFAVQGHHYALVLIDGLEPDRVYTYRVELDGEPVWPEPVAPPDGPAFPASTIRTLRDVGRPPGLEVADFEEYTRLYWEAWGDPVLRWLLSTVPTAMIFDDHDISDDWNTSAAWVEHMRAQPWWEERITSGLATYWLYQHLGNLSPDDLDDDPVWPKVPYALAPAIHHLEEWNEAVAAGAWGRAMAWVGEKIRQGIDLEHWAAFNDSFDRLAALIEAVAGRHRGPPPGSGVVLSGDVHHTYPGEVSFRGEHAGHGHSPAWQAVCSPLRNPLPRDQRAAHRRAVPPPAPGGDRGGG